MKLSIDCPKSGYDKVEDIDLASWDELIEMNKSHLENIESEAKQLIKDKMDKFSGYIPLVPVSMGKDSMVTCHLVREYYPDTKAIFNNTTLDCADTYRMAKTFPNCEMMTPKQGFYQYIKEQNVVFNRISRGCCRIFKVGEMVNQLDHDVPYLMFMGMRNEESSTRSDYGDMWRNNKWRDNWQGCLPIRKWSEFDVWLYTLKHNVEINPKYKKGYSRCGCAIACPFATKYTWVLDEYWYPKMRERWKNILNKSFIKNNRWTRMNCTKDEYLKCWNGGLYRPEPTEEVINEFMEYKGITDRNVALQYFNKTCCECGKNVRQNDVLAMNLKMNGRNTNKIYCKKCLMKELNMSKEEWDNNVADFKAQGCKLF